MELGTVTPEAPEAIEDRAPEERTSGQIYRYSTWLHLGPAAETCEQGESGDCQNRLHFHAWCRLPNELQIRDIREKAKAAKARRARQLRDPNTDSYEILEDELDELARLGDAGRKQTVDDLLGKTWFQDYLEAVQDVRDEDGEDGEKLYALIEEDDKRFQELDAMDPEKRPQEEYDELDRHLEEYTAKVEARLREIQEPRRENLTALDINALIDMVRADRIQTSAMDDFNVTYSKWEWYLCTYVTPNDRRRFASIEELEAAAPEIIEALKATFNDLERSFGEGVGKDS